MRKGVIIVIGICSAVIVLNLINSHQSTFKNAENLDFPSLDKSALQNTEVTYSSDFEDQPFARSEFEILRTQSPRTGRIPLNIRKRELEFARRLPNSNSLSFSKGGRTNVIAANFTSRGPVNVGGRTRALAFDVSDDSDNTLLAGGVSGGMWRTTNRGLTWTRTTTPDQFPSVASIIQDTRSDNQHVWYYGTGEIAGNSASGNGGANYRGDGIYKSTDSGQSWTLIPETSDGDITNTDNPFRFINRLVIDPSNASEREIYVAAIDAIIRTTDDFQTYEVVLGDTANSNSSLYSEVAITSSGRLYATLSDDDDSNPNIGIWTSATGDPGSWTEIPVPNGSPNSGFQRTSIGISPSNEDIVYFFRTESSGEDYNLYVYDHSDQSIVARPQSALPLDLGEPVGILNTQNSYDQYVKVHPDSPNTVFLGAVNLYRSTNGFADGSTNQWIAGYSFDANEAEFVDLYISSHPDQHELVFFPNNANRAVAANDGGISMTLNILKSDTTTDSYFDTFFNQTVADNVIVDWNPIDTGYMTSQFYTVAINQTDAEFPWITGGMQDNSTYISDVDSPTSSWGDLFGGDGSYAQHTYNSLFVSAQYAQMARLSLLDDGTESGTISPPPASGEDRTGDYLFINPILADPVSPNKVFVASRGRIYYTFDVTENPSNDDWFALGESTIPQNSFVTAMDASVSPANELVFAARLLGSSVNTIYRVEDTNNPVQITNITGNNLPGGFINCIAIDPRDADHIILVYSNYDVISLFSTTNGGDTWTGVAGNLEENPDGSGNGVSTRWLEILPNGDENIYLVGTSAGLFYTEELSGQNTEWTQAGANTIGNVVVDMLAARSVDGYVVAATHGKGTYQTYIDVPLQAHIYVTDYPCSGRSFTVLANRRGTSSTSNFNFTYEWFENGQLIEGLSGPGITGQLTSSTVLQARVTNIATGEQAFSNEISLVPLNNSYCQSIPLSVASADQENLAVYPNPATEKIILRGIGAFSKTNKIVYAVIDVAGKGIKNGFLESNVINISDLNPGSYFLKLGNGSDSKTIRFVKK